MDNKDGGWPPCRIVNGRAVVQAACPTSVYEQYTGENVIIKIHDIQVYSDTGVKSCARGMKVPGK